MTTSRFIFSGAVLEILNKLAEDSAADVPSVVACHHPSQQKILAGAEPLLATSNALINTFFEKIELRAHF